MWSRKDLSALVSPRVMTVGALFICASVALADVPTGSEANARIYYARTAKEIGFSTPTAIFDTTLGDVAAYLGYAGLTGSDLQDLPSSVLMSPERLVTPCVADGGTCAALPSTQANELRLRPPRRGDILATRFFAPKIMKINEPEATRQLGWRKLVRLRARPGSQAEVSGISAGIILFNFFTAPGVRLGSGDESVNTQVMLLTEPSRILAPNKGGPPTMYWLDYNRISDGGKLSLALEATFDADELQDPAKGVRPYFVPDGCDACHGTNSRRPMVNYLDTDHWFDRLENDFPKLKAAGIPLLVDAETNDESSVSYSLAFDVIRQFNEEADAQAKLAQPRHVEVLAAEKWVSLHRSNNLRVPPVERGIGKSPTWSADKAGDVETIGVLNQYCFRCHGTIKFSVFDRQWVMTNAAMVRASISPTAATKAHSAFKKMPPDRELPPEARQLILDFLNRSGK